MVSNRPWTVASLLTRLAMVAVLVMSVRLIVAFNHWYFNYSDIAGYKDASRYVLASSFVGLAGTLLQIPVALYILCKSNKMMVSVLLLEISMYADVVISLVLASGVGASIDLNGSSGRTSMRRRRGNRCYIFFDKGVFAIVFLLAGLLLSACASAASAQLRARANAD